MFTFILCIALIDLGIGYYLGTWVLVLPKSLLPLSLTEKSAQENPAPAPPNSPSNEGEAQVAAPEHGLTRVNSAKVPSTVSAKSSWKASSSNLRTEISAINDRIHYASAANDKQLAKDVAAEIRMRTQFWQGQLQDQLVLIETVLLQDSTAHVDRETPELCLAQIETLQTNLELLDWADSTEITLRKLEHEVAAVMNLLPAIQDAS